MKILALLIAAILVSAPAAAGYVEGMPGADDRRVAIPGHAWVQVYSRSTLREAKAVADRLSREWPYTSIFLSRNGWYAITVGAVRERQARQLTRAWKQAGRIPHDSYPTSGHRYVRKIVFARPAPVPRAEPSRQRSRRPAVCYRVSAFCRDVTAAATVCGFAVQGRDSSAAGGAVSGAMCTALVGEASGIGVDLGDVILSGLAGVAGNAMANAETADDFIGSALLTGLLTYGAYAKCTASVNRACGR